MPYDELQRNMNDTTRKQLLKELSSKYDNVISKSKKVKNQPYVEYSKLPKHGDPKSKDFVRAIISSSVTPDERGDIINFSSSIASFGSNVSEYSFLTCTGCGDSSGFGASRSGGVTTPP